MDGAIFVEDRGMFAVHLFELFAGLCLALFTLPLALELAVLTAAAALPPRLVRRGDGSGVVLDVIIPAHNEEKLIAQCVRSLRESSGPNVRVVVLAHNCTDETAGRAESAGATVFRLNEPVGGKGTALRFGFSMASSRGADAVLVIDADSVVSPQLCSAVCDALASGVDALQCRYQVANAGASARIRLVALAFTGMNVLRPRGRHRLGLSCGIFGNGFAVSTRTLARIPYSANSIVEDLEYHLQLVREGMRVVYLDDAAVYGEMPTSSSGAVSQRSRWEGGRILMRRQWTRPLTLAVLQGKLRMLEPLLDVLALPLASEVGLLALVVLLGLVGHAAGLLIYGIVALSAIAAYVLGSAFLGPEPAQTLQALIFVPRYMLWKLFLYPRTRLAARRDAAWIRTKRNT